MSYVKRRLRFKRQTMTHLFAVLCLGSFIYVCALHPFFLLKPLLLNNRTDRLGNKTYEISGGQDRKILTQNNNTNDTNTPFLQQKRNVFMKYFKRDRIVKSVNCQKIFRAEADEINRAKTIHKIQSDNRNVSTNVFISLWQNSNNCTAFKALRGYILNTLTETEAEFPLAFSIVMYKDVVQVERLLRAIYRPQNVYCIHVDTKASKLNKNLIARITRCFGNVFLSSASVSVVWGRFTVLLAEILCMKDLWKYRKWKYFINLTGQEFPLKTNLEIVKILDAMKGANIVDGSRIRAVQTFASRWQNAPSPPPHNIRLTKGSVHVAVNRDFVDFCLHDNRSHDFLLWLRPTFIPDETYFSSLNHSPELDIPGTFTGKKSREHQIRDVMQKIREQKKQTKTENHKGGKNSLSSSHKFTRTKNPKIRIGWQHHKNSAYKQVFFKNGGGIREFPLPTLDTDVGDIILLGTDVFFPDGVSKFGRLEDMEVFPGDYAGRQIKSFQCGNAERQSLEN